jgi:hypothetical protein
VTRTVFRGAPVLDGLTEAEATAEKLSMKNLVAYLLTHSSLAGKTVILANLEGDWELRSDHYGDISYEPCNAEQTPAMVDCNGRTEPNRALRVASMQAWLAARQSGVDAARLESPTKWSCPPTPTTVCVLNAAEVNHVQRAMTTDRMTMTNDVLPALQKSTGTTAWCCDAYAYSFWDVDQPTRNHYTPRTLIERLNHIKSKVDDSPPFGHSNVILTEYGAGTAAYDDDALAQTKAMRYLTEAAIAWGTPYTAYWQLYDGMAVNIDPPNDVDFRVRATNEQTDASGLIRPDGSTTPLHSYFQTVNMLRIGLRTTTGSYVSADDAGGSLIHVTAPWLRAWEELTIVDTNGVTLESGDVVNVLTKDAYYFMAYDNGGGSVVANSEHDLDWERFTILKQNGSGTIGSGDVVAFRTGSGHYFTTSGADGQLHATATTIGLAERFTLGTIPVACTYGVSPTQQSASSSGGSFTAVITAAAGCGWTVASNEAWMTVTTPVNGSGNATVAYTVAAHTGNSRSGIISLAGETGTVATISVTQHAPCPNAVTPASAAYAAAGGNGVVTVNADSACGWSVASDSSWITVTSSANGSGNGTVSYTVAMNTGGNRSGTITVSNRQVTVMQEAPAPGPPMNVAAITLTNNSVRVTWSPSSTAGITGYYVYCSTAGGGFINITPSPVQSPFTHSPLQPTVAYRYKVLAWNGNVVSSDSNTALATTIVFDDPVINRYQTPVRAIHFLQLRQAIDAVRQAAGLDPASYTTPSLCQAVTAQNQCQGGRNIRWYDLQELRDRLVSALPILNVATPALTDPSLCETLGPQNECIGSVRIKKEHIDELRAAVQ